MIVLVTIFYLATIRPGHDWGGDFSLYIQHAANLAEGRDYADTNYVPNPLYPFLSPPTYPPVFPLLLAPVYALFGLNLTAMKMVGIVCFVLALGVLCAMRAKQWPQSYQIALIAIVGFNPYFWLFKDNVLSDFPFLLFTYLSLGLIDRYAQADIAGRRAGAEVTWGIATGVTIYLAYGTRSVGLVILMCFFLCQIWRYHRDKLRGGGWHTALVFGSAGVGIAVQKMVIDRGHGYMSQLLVYGAGIDIVIALIKANLNSMLDGIFQFWQNGFGPNPVTWLVSILASVMAAMGYGHQLRARPSVYELFVPMYFLIVLLWPMGQDPRFLLPLLPLYVLYMLQGARWIFPQVRSRWGPPLMAASALVVAASYIGHFTNLNFGPIREGVETRQALDLFAFIRTQTKPDDVLIFAKPRVTGLFTGRRSAALHLGGEESSWLTFIETIRATHLIVTRWWPWEQGIGEFVWRHPDRFKLMHQSTDVFVYRIRE